MVRSRFWLLPVARVWGRGAFLFLRLVFGGTPIEKMKAISKGVMKSAIEEGLIATLLLFSLIAENERLKGRLEVLDDQARLVKASQKPGLPVATHRRPPDQFRLGLWLYAAGRLEKPQKTWLSRWWRR